jgi:type I restriction enzyme, S subunit
LSAWINSGWGRAWSRAVRTDGVSQSNISAKKLRRMPVPLPPLQRQQEILSRLGDLSRFADVIEARIQRAEVRANELADAILAKAFNGELVPTEAELARREGRDYEPASALLERIRPHRQARQLEGGVGEI